MNMIYNVWWRYDICVYVNVCVYETLDNVGSPLQIFGLGADLHCEVWHGFAKKKIVFINANVAGPFHSYMMFYSVSVCHLVMGWGHGVANASYETS